MTIFVDQIAVGFRFFYELDIEEVYAILCRVPSCYLLLCCIKTGASPEVLQKENFIQRHVGSTSSVTLLEMCDIRV
jgi:hypothetical protein